MSENIKELLEKIKEGKKIAIIGEGKIGKIIADILIQNSKTIYKQIVFLVDDGYKKHEEYRQIPIWEISEFKKMYGFLNIVFINTVTSIESQIYKERLKKQGIKGVIDFNSSEMAVSLLKEYWSQYLIDKKINMEETILKIGKFKFPNPFLGNVPTDVLYSFLTDIRDLIVPCWLGDYSKCVDGPYEFGNVEICEGDVVIDCGANIGISSANANAKKCKKVYAIEPIDNDSLNKCKNLFGEKMSIHYVALSNYEGTADIHINPNASNDNSIYYIQNTLIESRTVEVTTIDSFCKNMERVDFIKLYIDDLEGRMLQGAKNTIVKHLPKIAIFPSLPNDVTELKKKLELMIKEMDNRYVVEYAYNKMFAYIAE